jgi:hypothetical protein
MRHHSGHFVYSRRGISAIELVLAVSLLTVVVGAASFKITSNPPVDAARHSATEFAAMLRDARSAAIKDHHFTTVSLDQTVAPPRWIFKSTAGFQSPASQTEFPIEGDVLVEGTPMPIRIDDHGNASYLGHWTFKAGSEYSVTLQPMGGTVTMKSAE